MSKAYVSDRKVPASVSIRESLYKKARSAGIDINAVMSNALELALGRDPEEVELEKLRREISSLEQVLGPKKARAISLQESVDRKKQLHLDLRLEEDCAAWYLRMLVQDQRISVVRQKPLDLESMFRHFSEEYDDFKNARLDGNRITFETAPSFKVITLMKRKGFEFSRDGKSSTWTEPKPSLSVSRQDCSSRLKIDFDHDMLLTDLSSESISGALPVSAFMVYAPRILDAAVKREIKSRMLPEYSNANVEVIG